MITGSGCAREGDVAAVILAAGSSRRMPGRSKLLRPFRGEAVLRVVTRVALEAGLRPVVVSIRSNTDPVARALDGLPVLPVPVPEAARGRIISVAAGLSALADDRVTAAMILLGDEPELEPFDVEAVRAAWNAGTGNLLRASFRDRPGHPVLIARSLFSHVADLAHAPEESGGVWERLTRAGTPGVEVRVDREAPIDVDSPSALGAARSRSSRA